MKKAQIFYADIGDYLTREQKLKIIRNTKSIENLEMVELHPNKDGDWINLRNDEFAEYIPIFDREKSGVKTTYFNENSVGIVSSRDAWVYNFSMKKLEKVDIGENYKKINLELDWALRFYFTHTI